MNNSFCQENCGCKVRIEKLEDNVKQLWDKWDFITKAVIGFLTTAALNLIGIIYLVVKSVK